MELIFGLFGLVLLIMFVGMMSNIGTIKDQAKQTRRDIHEIRAIIESELEKRDRERLGLNPFEGETKREV